MGFQVDSYECNKALVENGNNFLLRYNVINKIKYLPKDAVPEPNKKYNGIIIGWGAYSHIRGFKNRLAFLSKLYSILDIDAPLMISFVISKERSTQDEITKNVSNFFRRFSGKYKSESGDKLMSYFIHFFTQEEIKKELMLAKFKVIDYYDKEYGCLIAVNDKTF